MKNILRFILMLVVLMSFSIQAKAEDSMKVENNVHSFSINDIDGKAVNLGQYKGKVLLIVNTASRCGYTKQYKGLESLYEKYKDQGLVVLGFPANNFGGQEPGSNEEIKNFCSLKFNVTFPMFAKSSVAGGDINPLYSYLISRPKMQGPISWNFNKFLVDTNGQVIARYDSSVDPMSEELTSAIEAALPKK